MVDDDDDSWKDKIYQIPPGGIDYGSRDYFRHRDNRWERRGKGAPADPAILRQEEMAGQSLNYDSYSDLVLEMLNGMRWNLIWYLPVCAYFILRVFWQNVELYWKSVVSTYRLAFLPALGKITGVRRLRGSYPFTAVGSLGNFTDTHFFPFRKHVLPAPILVVVPASRRYLWSMLSPGLGCNRLMAFPARQKWRVADSDDTVCRVRWL